MEQIKKIIELLVLTPVEGGFCRFAGCLFIYPLIAIILAAPLAGFHKLINIIKTIYKS